MPAHQSQSRKQSTEYSRQTFCTTNRQTPEQHTPSVRATVEQTDTAHQHTRQADGHRSKGGWGTWAGRAEQEEDAEDETAEFAESEGPYTRRGLGHSRHVLQAR